MDPDPGGPKMCGSATLYSCEQRDGEFKQRSYLRGFCHNPHRGVDAGRHSCKTPEYKSSDSPLHLLLNVMYCVRVSLRIVKYSLSNTKKKGVVGYLLYFSGCEA
jgi:hypothetical protein